MYCCIDLVHVSESACCLYAAGSVLVIVCSGVVQMKIQIEKKNFTHHKHGADEGQPPDAFDYSTAAENEEARPNHLTNEAAICSLVS